MRWQSCSRLPVALYVSLPFPANPASPATALGGSIANELVSQAYAAQLGAHSCSCNKPQTNCPRLVNNVIINGGKDRSGAVDLNIDRVMRCREAQADTAFLWFAFAAFCATFALSFLAWRRK